ncbi:MAG: Adenine DNA glycosylase [Nitrospira sp.]|nr:Adenine DNA glycosylase [Nitrospira sp.]
MQARVLGWYRLHGRAFPWRRARLPLYQRVVSEVLLQRTQAATVANFYDHFFERFPSWKSLATARATTIGAIIRPIGLWRRRSVSLKQLATEMARRGGRLPTHRVQIEQLPRVGQYIANAILLFKYNQPEPLLDVNMARIIERHYSARSLADLRDDPGLQLRSRALLSGLTHRQAWDMNWALLDLGSLICKPARPECERCPIALTCNYRIASIPSGVSQSR